MPLIMLLTTVLLVLFFRAAVLMFAWAAVANTFGWPTLSFGAAIATILVVGALTGHLTQKAPVVKKDG